MGFLCTTRDKEVSYHQCINECQYFFKSACIDKMNESYNQALEDLKSKIDDEYCDGGYGDYHEVEMIVRMIEELKK